MDHIEAVPVDAAAQAGGTHQAPADAARQAVPRLPRHAAPNRQWGRLRQLPSAIGVLLLDLLPLALFVFLTAVSSRWLGGTDVSFRLMIRAVAGAYVGMRIAMAVLRLLVAPDGCGIPVLRVRPGIARTLYRWLRLMIVTAACGVGLAGMAGALGAGLDERLAIMKAVSLLVHLFAVVLILRIRRPVGAIIVASARAGHPLAIVRQWLAQTWASFAIVLVMGIWVVWALGVHDGFQKLLHFIGVTAAVTIAARIVAILVLGALGRMFHVREANAAAPAMPDGDARQERYYVLGQRLVTIAISVCTVVVLLQVWGFDVVGWLTQGPIGRRILSAITTTAVAAIVGILIWEVANAGIERRLTLWSKHGDVVRAARLRTLLPILRTCLFIVIALVIGLTALNEIGINTTPLLASASIVGVALGFGSQKLVQDFITGIFLLLENAIQVGDWVTVAGVSGTVEDLSIRTVRLRAGDGSLHIVPFSSVTTVNNSNRGLGNAAMRVSVGFGTDIERVMNELKRIGTDLKADPNFRDNILGDLEIWGVDAVDGSTVTLAGQMRCTDKGRWGVQRELNRRILERFRQLGIQIADPRATVLLPREAPPPVASAVQQAGPDRSTNDEVPAREPPVAKR
ncbi:mechanosensitive ion channel [Oxalobacteraceae bacterium OM1]|nr:mechanosensitive ion channel [Oxalobacteraceae bacterium OM1]